MPEYAKIRYAELNTDENAVLNEAVEATYAAVVNSELDLAVDSNEAEEDGLWLKQQLMAHKSLHWLRRPSIIMISICVFFLAFATASAEPSRQLISVKLTCNYVAAKSGTETCDPVKTQILYLNLEQAYIISIGLATIMSLGKMGSLSDQHGRRLFLILMTIVQALGKMVKMAVMSSSNELRFVPMVMAEFFANLCGGVLTLLMLSNCYVSDIAEVHQRTFYLGIIMALFFLGLSLGPGFGNLLTSLENKPPVTASASATSMISVNEYLPLKAEILIILTVLCFEVLVLPESRTEGARRMSRSLSHSLLRALLMAAEVLPGSFSLASINFLRPLRILTYPDDVVPPLRRSSIRITRIAVMTLVACDCILVALIIAFGQIFMLYPIFRFNWDAKQVGAFLTVLFSLRAVTLLLISPLLNHKVFMGFFGLRASKLRFDRLDWAMMMTGYVTEFLGMLVIGRCLSTRLYLVVMGLTSLGSLSMPAMSSGLVKFFPELRLGEVFGGLAMVKNSLQIVFPYLFLNLYKKLVLYGHPEYVFYCMAFVFAICILATSWVQIYLDKEDARITLEDEGESGLRRGLHHRNSSFTVGL